MANQSIGLQICSGIIEGATETPLVGVYRMIRNGNKSVAYNDLGASIDHNAQVLLVQKLLSELARDPGGGKFKDLHQQKDDQQLQPMQRPVLGGIGGSWGCGVAGGSGTNP